jgi:hypothetical protein
MDSALPCLRCLDTVFSSRRPGFQPRSIYVRFVVDKMAFGKVLSGYCGFPYQSFHRQLHIHHPSSGAGTVGQTVDSVSLHPLSQKLIIDYVTSQLPRHGNCCITYAFLLRGPEFGPWWLHSRFYYLQYSGMYQYFTILTCAYVCINHFPLPSYVFP